jgi:hypothetical protein
MKLKVEQFCSLATSPSWQAWLYKYNPEIYADFIKKIKLNNSCTRNKEYMTDVLTKIDQAGGGDDLCDFLLNHYPYVIDGIDFTAVKPNRPVFEYYNPDILTFPRRIVFTGSNLKRQVNSFVIDKIKYDSIIVDGVAYVEYLTSEDKGIMYSIPSENWQIASYRLAGLKRI